MFNWNLRMFKAFAQKWHVRGSFKYSLQIDEWCGEQNSQLAEKKSYHEYLNTGWHSSLYMQCQNFPSCNNISPNSEKRSLYIFDGNEAELFIIIRLQDMPASTFLLRLHNMLHLTPSTVFMYVTAFRAISQFGRARAKFIEYSRKFRGFNPLSCGNFH